MGLATELSWPAARLPEAIASLGRRSGLATGSGLSFPPPDGWGDDELEEWMAAAAGQLGLEAEPIEVAYPEVDRLIRGAGPALIRLPGAPEPRLLALLGGGRGRVALLTPDRTIVRVRPEALRAAWCAPVEAPVAAEVDRLLDRTGQRGRRRARVRRALLRERLAARRLGGAWLLHAAGAGIGPRAAGLPRTLLRLLGAHACQYALWLLSWWLLGWMALTGRFDPGWLGAWLLLLLTLVPFRLATTALAGQFSIHAGAWLRRRLLVGALKLEPESVRRLGVGRLLGRVIESEVVESMALAGGLLSLTAAVELVMAGLVLAVGAGGPVHAALLLGWVLATLWLGVRFYRRRLQWTEQRLDLTDHLVEGMIGHRTRLAQDPRRFEAGGDDRALDRYLRASSGLDRTGTSLQAIVPRCWLMVGLLGLAPAFVADIRPAAELAIGVGGVLLAYRSFRSLAEGAERLAAAAIAWASVRPLWRAADRLEPSGRPDLAIVRTSGRGGDGRGRVVLEARALVFGYPDRPGPVLRGASVRIRAGDRLLLEGPSGGGKSTLALVLAGVRAPGSGLLLLDGLDRQTLGTEGWRRRVAVAPQFHDNHILIGTLAFNVLMGRSWPPRPADLEEAERICRAVGLGALLDRMPAGLHQMIGETGWQLSHGERSRLYLARALLQRAELIILDESFAALDPETLRQALRFVWEESPTVLTIAHP